MLTNYPGDVAVTITRMSGLKICQIIVAQKSYLTFPGRATPFVVITCLRDKCRICDGLIISSLKSAGYYCVPCYCF